MLSLFNKKSKNLLGIDISSSSIKLQDSVVPGSGAVPAIATNSVTTRVLVNNGDTVVLGGVFREEVTTSVTKTPILGDLPYIGNAFKRTEDSRSKTELLIFITPSVINELL